jgi:glycosyltransferase involved in cell wall biosynthesis
VNPTPTLSVVIPALLEERLIEGALLQFTPELRKKHAIEIIVSDGGSTDDTLTISRRHADRVIEHTEPSRQNISMGRNIGARAATGSILMFINADTLIDDIDHFIPAVIDEAEKDGVSGVTCSVGVHRHEERAIDRIFHTVYNRYFHFLNLVGMGMGRGECQVVRRELFERIGGYNERIAAGEDFDLFVRLRRLGSISFLSKHMVRESPRRYRRLGYGYISILWFLNAFSVLLFKRSVATEWKPIR